MSASPAPPSRSPLPTTSSDHAPRDTTQAQQREAFEHWGYLFQPDKTGTDTLKRFLRSLKDEISRTYDPSPDSPDLTPNQLARFYRELHGNYDQLFLGTPSESIAFIYKSLGCLHSLQPQSNNHSTAFADPTVPALKTEGWIMWQTIQLLLGPDEHAGFLSEAVQKWDVKDPATGKPFPNILPRECFPLEPDKHMVQWYEGVSERLRKEAEDEEIEKRAMGSDPAEVRRIHDRVGQEDEEDEASTDSRGPALAYFRNPLYRHVDGRPSIVRRGSKRPIVSTRPPGMVEKGKEAAGTFGGIVRHIGSPHLWDGRGSNTSNGESREREKDRVRRRRASLPDHRHHSRDSGPPTPAAYDTDLAPPDAHHHRHRRRTTPDGRLDPAHRVDDDDEWDDDVSPAYNGRSPGPGSRPGSHHRHNSGHLNDPSLRHTRSHDPTPSQRESGDYFGNYAEVDKPSPRRNSGYDHATSPAYDNPTPIDDKGHGLTVPGAAAAQVPGAGFAPSASPLFATHVARHPQPAPYQQPPSSARAGSADPYSRPHPSSTRHGHGHHRLGSRDEYDRRDDVSKRRFDSPRRPEDGPLRQYDNPRRSARFDSSISPPHDVGSRSSAHKPGTNLSRSPERRSPRNDPRDDGGDRRGGHDGSRRGSRFDPNAMPRRTPPPHGYEGPTSGRPPSSEFGPDYPHGRRPRRRTGSEGNGDYGDGDAHDRDRERRLGRGSKQTRFAPPQDRDREKVADRDIDRYRDKDDRERERPRDRDREGGVTDRGVHGRQYINETPWK